MPLRKHVLILCVLIIVIGGGLISMIPSADDIQILKTKEWDELSPDGQSRSFLDRMTRSLIPVKYEDFLTMEADPPPDEQELAPINPGDKVVLLDAQGHSDVISVQTAQNVITAGGRFALWVTNMGTEPLYYVHPQCQGFTLSRRETPENPIKMPPPPGTDCQKLETKRIEPGESSNTPVQSLVEVLPDGTPKALEPGTYLLEFDIQRSGQWYNVRHTVVIAPSPLSIQPELETVTEDVPVVTTKEPITLSLTNNSLASYYTQDPCAIITIKPIDGEGELYRLTPNEVLCEAPQKEKKRVRLDADYEEEIEPPSPSQDAKNGLQKLLEIFTASEEEDESEKGEESNETPLRIPRNTLNEKADDAQEEEAEEPTPQSSAPVRTETKEGKEEKTQEEAAPVKIRIPEQNNDEDEDTSDETPLRLKVQSSEEVIHNALQYSQASTLDVGEETAQEEKPRLLTQLRLNLREGKLFGGEAEEEEKDFNLPDAAEESSEEHFIEVLNPQRIKARQTYTYTWDPRIQTECEPGECDLITPQTGTYQISIPVQDNAGRKYYFQNFLQLQSYEPINEKTGQSGGAVRVSMPSTISFGKKVPLRLISKDAQTHNIFYDCESALTLESVSDVKTKSHIIPLDSCIKAPVKITSQNTPKIGLWEGFAYREEFKTLVPVSPGEYNMVFEYIEDGVLQKIRQDLTVYDRTAFPQARLRGLASKVPADIPLEIELVNEGPAPIQYLTRGCEPQRDFYIFLRGLAEPVLPSDVPCKPPPNPWRTIKPGDYAILGTWLTDRGIQGKAPGGSYVIEVPIWSGSQFQVIETEFLSTY